MRSDNVQGGQVPGLDGGGGDDDAAVTEGEGGGAANQAEGGEPMAGQAIQTRVTEGIEDLPDPGPGQENENGGLTAPEEPDIIGPVTRSRRKLMKPNL